MLFNHYYDTNITNNILFFGYANIISLRAEGRDERLDRAMEKFHAGRLEALSQPAGMPGRRRRRRRSDGVVVNRRN